MQNFKNSLADIMSSQHIKDDHVEVHFPMKRADCPKKVPCFICDEPIKHGKQFSYYDYIFCSMSCLRDHKKANLVKQDGVLRQQVLSMFFFIFWCEYCIAIYIGAG